jgi:hypothetical protein
MAEKPLLENQTTADLLVEKPMSEKPMSENPTSDKPTSENRTTSNTIYNNTISSNTNTSNIVFSKTAHSDDGGGLSTKKCESPPAPEATVAYFPKSGAVNKAFSECMTFWRNDIKNFNPDEHEVRRRKTELERLSMGEDGKMDEDLAVAICQNILDKSWHFVYSLDNQHREQFEKKRGRPPMYNNMDNDTLEAALLAN